MTAIVGYCLAAWATGYVLGFKLRQIRSALQAA
jgi:hypothetical protein